MKTNILLKIIAVYYIVYSILNAISIAYELFFNSFSFIECVVVIVAFAYLFMTIVASLKLLRGSFKALKVLRILIILQILFFQLNGYYFEMQNGAGVNLYMLFHKGIISYASSFDYLKFDLQARIVEGQVNYIAVNIIPIIFCAIMFYKPIQALQGKSLQEQQRPGQE